MKLIGKIIKTLLIFVLVLILIVVIYVFIKQPSNDRDWWENSSVLATLEIQGDEITIKNVRDWTYDTNGPTSKKWIDRTYNLNDLEAMWFIVVPFAEWDGLAHTMVSFDFRGQDPIVISIEARKEIGEEYKLVSGILNEFEIIYIWGTERDFIGRRAITQGDPIYMYPLDISLDFSKKFFIDLAETTNQLAVEPGFYNTFVNNCTNKLAISANKAKPGTVPIDKARIFPGFSFDLLYKMDYVKDFDQKEIVRQKYYISDIVKNIKNQDNFSAELRAGLDQ